MRVLIDTNVIVDVIECRKEFFENSYAVCRLAAEEKLEAITPAGSVADAHYIIRKSGRNAAEAKDAIAALLELVPACDTTASDVTIAFILEVPDFEDAILAATARRENTEYIVTRDAHDFDKSPVPAISPADFLTKFREE